MLGTFPVNSSADFFCQIASCCVGLVYAQCTGVRWNSGVAGGAGGAHSSVRGAIYQLSGSRRQDSATRGFRPIHAALRWGDFMGFTVLLDFVAGAPGKTPI